MTSRSLPSRPSHYVSMILAPLHQFLQVGWWHLPLWLSLPLAQLRSLQGCCCWVGGMWLLLPGTRPLLLPLRL